ncbi:MAG: TRAP transporter large permease [Saccharofermentanales bacterium]|jgi:C4-dicarboxylate transporter DctM subunit|nr:TRAP transporter large permease [Clostridiaceae bacterium]
MSTVGIFFILAVVLLAIGVPVAATLGLAAVVYILLEGIPTSVVIQQMFAGVDVVVLMCIPFFILAGDLMAKGGIAKRLVRVANLVVGNITGGLAYVTIIVCALFAAMTGSAMACCFTVGTIMIPFMDEAGYDRAFSAAVVASGAILGPIIPPSTAMIIYAANTDTSIASLYKLGVPAGLILAFAMCVLSYFYCKRKGYKGVSKTTCLDLPPGEKLTAKIVVKTVVGALPALGSPIIILGCIFGGITTPTEASVIAVLYSFIIGMFVYREIKVKDIFQVLLKSAKSTAKVMYIVAAAGLFAWVISYARVPQTVLSTLTSISDSRAVLYFIMMLVLLIMGCVMEATPILLITIPIFMPICDLMNISRLHFGICMCIAVCIGFITPPFGTCLFTVMDVAKVSMAQVVRKIYPYVIVMILILFLLVYVPQLTMFVL